MLAGALALTTEYIRTRKQFGRALAEFQAVTMQIADVYIAGRALDVAMWSGAWRLADGPAAERRTWPSRPLTDASEALRRSTPASTCTAGSGVDVTYPLHRYFALRQAPAPTCWAACDAQLDPIGALV